SSVQPGGKDINFSTHSGLSNLPTIPDRGRLLSQQEWLHPLFQSRWVGVGHNWTAIVSGIPAPFPLFAVILRRSRRGSHVAGVSPSWATDALGLGHDPEAIPSVGRAKG